MKNILSLIAIGGLLASTAVSSAAEPTFLQKIRASANKSYRIASKPIPRLFRKSSTSRRIAFEVPPVPAAEGGTGAPELVVPPGKLEPMPTGPDGVVGAVESVTLFPCVKYEDLDNVHPCAVKKIVAVKDPCYDPCSCKGPGCVYVQICVPPCGCPRVKVTRSGRKVKYDYGQYEVTLKSRRGVVYVDYDDGILF